MINRAEQALENKLVNDVASLKRDIIALKSPQPIGADVLAITSIPTGAGVSLLVGPVTVTAGSSTTFTVTSTPVAQTLTLWNFALTLYVDSSASTNEWPGGASLTSAQRNLVMMPWLDFANSSDTLNTRVFKVRVKNDDVSSHDYYLKFKAYLPELS